MSALAFSVGALIIVPPFVTVFATCRRVQQAQALGQTPSALNGWIAGSLYVGSLITFGLTFPVFCAYVQSQMNAIWASPLTRHTAVGSNASSTVSSEVPFSDDPPAPEWYPDPTRQARLRYWDGGAWTEHTAA